MRRRPRWHRAERRGAGSGACAASRSRRTRPGGVRRTDASSSSKDGAKLAGRGVRKSGRVRLTATKDISRSVSSASSPPRTDLRHGRCSADNPGSRSTRRLSTVSCNGETANRVSARSSTPSSKLIIKSYATSIGSPGRRGDLCLPGRQRRLLGRSTSPRPRRVAGRLRARGVPRRRRAGPPPRGAVRRKPSGCWELGYKPALTS